MSPLSNIILSCRSGLLIYFPIFNNTWCSISNWPETMQSTFEINACLLAYIII